ncbi:unnamed protein product, partial [Anisakis simplex]|uniref:Uncharacterized protein n=1 Tax=Anisakis simplex TaxID=6269 RepID=A0A0M3JE45_ANISI
MQGSQPFMCSQSQPVSLSSLHSQSEHNLNNNNNSDPSQNSNASNTNKPSPMETCAPCANNIGSPLLSSDTPSTSSHPYFGNVRSSSNQLFTPSSAGLMNSGGAFTPLSTANALSSSNFQNMNFNSGMYAQPSVSCSNSNCSTPLGSATSMPYSRQAQTAAAASAISRQLATLMTSGLYPFPPLFFPFGNGVNANAAVNQ